MDLKSLGEENKKDLPNDELGKGIIRNNLGCGLVKTEESMERLFTERMDTARGGPFSRTNAELTVECAASELRVTHPYGPDLCRQWKRVLERSRGWRQMWER